MSGSTQRILVAHDLVVLPGPAVQSAPAAAVTTVAANIAYFGFALSAEAYGALSRLSEVDLGAWWGELEPILAALTGDDKRMGDFVVYKNFPAEVIEMTEVDYWARQILMYWGLPNEIFTEEPRPRLPLTAAPRPRVLHLAGPDAVTKLRDALFAEPARWTDGQWAEVAHLAGATEGPLDLSRIPFVENRIRLAALLSERGAAVVVANATDVLRLAVALSEGDISLRIRTRLRGFSRRERRYLLSMLEGAAHLDEDVSRRPEAFKRLLHALRPGDYADKCPRVVAAYDVLYRNAAVPGFAADLERLLAAGDPGVVALTATRPGEYARRLRKLVSAVGDEAVAAFPAVAGRLTTFQLLRLERYLSTVDGRSTRLFPPRGNWARVQLVAADTAPAMPPPARERLIATIGVELRRRLAGLGSVALAQDTKGIKLPTSDSDLAPYGRGTVFPIPRDVHFVRTASFWRTGQTHENRWFDNGWNFFGPDWTRIGECCWNSARFYGRLISGPTRKKKRNLAAVFSGDPTNSKDLDGRACQLIDLYLDQLVDLGVRYAVWSLLCYSRIPFAAAEEVHAALMWGREPERGKLFEPARCQLSFPLRGAYYTSYVAYLDLARRRLVFLDANLRASVHSAGNNGERLTTLMPAYLEYLDSLPSVHDLFRHAPQDPDGMPVVYDDSARPIVDRPAYVFRPSNPDSSFTPVAISEVLASADEAMAVLPSIN